MRFNLSLLSTKRNLFEKMSGKIDEDLTVTTTRDDVNIDNNNINIDNIKNMTMELKILLIFL